jgi:ribonuclease R
VALTRWGSDLRFVVVFIPDIVHCASVLSYFDQGQEATFLEEPFWCDTASGTQGVRYLPAGVFYGIVNTMKNKKYTVTGTISTTQKGVGFVDMPDASGKKSKKVDRDESVHIEVGFLNTALNGDIVEVSVQEKKVGGKTEKEGEVIKVISRARETFVGTAVIENNSFYVAPDDRKMYTNIFLSKDDVKNLKNGDSGDKGLKNGDKVFVRILPWNDPKKDLCGKIIKILGKKGVNDVEMESIVLENGFEVGFSATVEKEAEEIGKTEKNIKPEEIAKRRDIRGTMTFTIDPFDAKDFDDAISFKELSAEEVAKFETSNTSGPLYEIGVHIADVSHYVREGTALDKEAVKRGCSVYLVDRTIPMLPETLSNDLCSLNPGADKLSFSAIFIMDKNVRILDRWFGRTVMNSDHRFTYETAQSVIDGDAGTVTKYSNGLQTVASVEAGMKYRDILVTLNRLAKILQKEKFSKGAIEFESEEIKFRLDENGKPIGVDVKQRLDTHKLVEEYMLLANKEVAKFIYDSIKKKGTRDTGAIYRIHDVPDKEKIVNLSIFVKALGYDLKTKDGEVTAKDFNNLLDQIEGTPHESLVRTAAIRSMQKAVYSTKNIGHFGLAFDFYTHFTSPIRRYPDLLVHRVLHKHLNNEPFGDRDIVAFQKIAEASTEREIDAADAERSSKKLKQVEYMSTRVGQTFKGRISGITKWGIYVEECETKSEGMIGFRNLGSDFFNFDPKTYSVTGEKSGQKFTLGDEVTFKVLGADLDKKTLDYGI